MMIAVCRCVTRPRLDSSLVSLIRHASYKQRVQFASVSQKPRSASHCHVRGISTVPNAQRHCHRVTTHQLMNRNFSTMTDKIRAYIALGSNMGHRLENLESACRHIDRIPGTKITRTSGLWDTEPMYVQNQDRFLNGVCEIETILPPITLLDELQSIENELGRVRVIDKGPRTVDLDILLYGDEVIHHDRLIVPHKLMLERSFVLQPLCEYVCCHCLFLHWIMLTSLDSSLRVVLRESTRQIHSQII